MLVNGAISLTLFSRPGSSKRILLPSPCDCRRKKGCRHCAASWLSVRLCATVASPLQARTRTTTPRHPRPSQIQSPCSRRLATPPRTITPSRPPSPTPPTCIQQTARWAETTATTARSLCYISRQGAVGARGRMVEERWVLGQVTLTTQIHKLDTHTQQETLWLSLVSALSTVV